MRSRAVIPRALGILVILESLKARSRNARTRAENARHYELGLNHRAVAASWGGTIESQGRNTFHEEINARGTLRVRDYRC